LNNAEQRLIADLLVQKLIKDLQAGLPLQRRGNEGEVIEIRRTLVRSVCYAAEPNPSNG